MKIGKHLGIAGLVTAGTILSGCDATMREDGANVLDNLANRVVTGGAVYDANSQIQANQGNYRAAAAWGALAETAQNDYNRQTAIDAAEAGRSDITINNYPSQKNRQIDLILCYWKDMNNNGKIDLNEISIRKTFYAPANVTILDTSTVTIPYNVDIKLFKDADVLSIKEMRLNGLTHDGFSEISALTFYGLTDGYYSAECSVNGEIIKELTFNVVNE